MAQRQTLCRRCRTSFAKQLPIVTARRRSEPRRWGWRTGPVRRMQKEHVRIIPEGVRLNLVKSPLQEPHRQVSTHVVADGHRWQSAPFLPPKPLRSGPWLPSHPPGLTCSAVQALTVRASRPAIASSEMRRPAGIYIAATMVPRAGAVTRRVHPMIHEQEFCPQIQRVGIARPTRGGNPPKSRESGTIDLNGSFGDESLT